MPQPPATPRAYKEGALTWKGDLQDILRIDPTDAVNQLCEHAGWAGFFGELYAEATRRSGRAYEQRKRREAERYEEIREEKTAAGEKVTEAALSKAVEMDPDIARLRDEENNAKADEKSLFQVVMSLTHRKEALVALISAQAQGATGGSYGQPKDWKPDPEALRRPSHGQPAETETGTRRVPPRRPNS